MRLAVITIIKDEDIFLPVWYNYYKKQVPETDIFIYDNDSKIKIPGEYKNFIPIHSGFEFDHIWLRQTLYKIMAYQLLFYDYVLCVDADEIVIPDPRKYKNIVDYVNKNKGKETIYSTGYEVFGKKADTPINFNTALFAQRHYWTKLKNFFKPVISSIPIKKMYSDYHCESVADPELYLAHLNRIDYATSYNKYNREKSYKWNPEDLKKTDGWQHRISNDSAFDEYYLQIKNSFGPVGPIPEWIKGTI